MLILPYYTIVFRKGRFFREKADFLMESANAMPKRLVFRGIARCRVKKAGFPWSQPMPVTRECSFFGPKSTLCSSNLYFAVWLRYPWPKRYPFCSKNAYFARKNHTFRSRKSTLCPGKSTLCSENADFEQKYRILLEKACSVFSWKSDDSEFGIGWLRVWGKG